MKDTTNGRTAEQRKAQAEALHASLIEQVQLLADSGQWRRFLDFARSFHTYSLNNLLLILAQDPDATMVAGFRQWQAKGRQVRRGEHAINIFGYSAKKTVGNDDSDSDAVERIVHYYPVLSVLDISQTDPIDGIPLPQNPIHQLTGKGDHGVIRPLTAQLEALGWTVARAPLTHANGHTDPEQHRITQQKPSSTRPPTFNSATWTTSMSTDTTWGGWKWRPSLSRTSSPAWPVSTPARTASVTSPDGPTRTFSKSATPHPACFTPRTPSQASSALRLARECA
ncbi:ArdC family protein [Leifsonia shinshuensis]